MMSIFKVQASLFFPSSFAIMKLFLVFDRSMTTSLFLFPVMHLIFKSDRISEVCVLF